MKIKIINNSGLNPNIEDMIQSLTVFAKDRLGFESHPSFHLNSDLENAQDTLGKTGYYDPNNMEIHIYVDGRHDKDILRSIAHELVHHSQNEQGSLNNQGYTGPGYAQKNPHLRNMEKEAYLKGNMCFRDWEDSYKETNYSERGNNMSLKEWKNNELNWLLMKKFGLLKENYYENKEEHDKDASEDDYSHIEKLKKDAHYDREHEDGSGYHDDSEKDDLTHIKKLKKDAHYDHEERESLEEKVFEAVMKTLKGK